MCAECIADPRRWTGDSDVAVTRALRVVFAAEIVQHFVKGRDVLSTRELAGLLWSFVRRREVNRGFIAARLGAEFEVVVTRNGGGHVAPPLRVRKVEPLPRDMRFSHSLRLLETSVEVRALPKRVR